MSTIDLSPKQQQLLECALYQSRAIWFDKYVAQKEADSDMTETTQGIYQQVCALCDIITEAGKWMS